LKSLILIDDLGVGNILVAMDYPATHTTTDSVRRVIKLNIDLREPTQVAAESARFRQVRTELAEQVDAVALAADPDWEPMV
jgi:hypothetical protein